MKFLLAWGDALWENTASSLPATNHDYQLTPSRFFCDFLAWCFSPVLRCIFVVPSFLVISIGFIFFSLYIPLTFGSWLRRPSRSVSGFGALMIMTRETGTYSRESRFPSSHPLAHRLVVLSSFLHSPTPSSSVFDGPAAGLGQVFPLLPRRA